MSMLPPHLQRSVLRCPPGGLSLLGAARRGVALLPRLPRSALRGFTLIEILVSLAIVSIALLAGSQAVQALSRGASCEQAGKVFTVAMEVRTTPNPNFRRLDTKVLDESTPILSIATIVGRN
jgi:general secretion pathway protein I